MIWYQDGVLKLVIRKSQFWATNNLTYFVERFVARFYGEIDLMKIFGARFYGEILVAIFVDIYCKDMWCLSK